MELRILAFGPSGSGKSSLLNSLRAAILGERFIGHYHQAGSVHFGGSYTSKICRATYGSLHLIDMGGVFESKQIKNSYIEDILLGKVSYQAELTDYLEVKNKDTMPTPPAGRNYVNCLLVILKQGAEYGVEVERLLDVVNSLAAEGRISRRLVVTHLDKVDSQFIDPTNLPHLTESASVQAVVKEMSDRTTIPSSATSIVRNYISDNETNMYSNILLLQTVLAVITEAKDCHERNISEIELEESS